MASSQSFKKNIAAPGLWLGLLFSYCLWYVVFVLRPGNFWLLMAGAALLLGSYAYLFGGAPVRFYEINAREVGIGLAGFALLYVIFVAGDILAALLYLFLPAPFAAWFYPDAVAGIYALGKGENPFFTGLLLFFVTSPCEEIFWRGFVQRWVMERLGGFKGWLIAALFYAGAHVVTGNSMLVLAAAVAGLFFGLLYLWRQNLVACIVAHALWTVTVFLILPPPLFLG